MCGPKHACDNPNKTSMFGIHAPRHPLPNYFKIIFQESLSQTQNIRKNLRQLEMMSLVGHVCEIKCLVDDYLATIP